MSKLKLVIFDCDGVMFDSMYANQEYYNHLLGKFGQPLMDRQAEDYVHSHNVMDAVDFIFRNNPQLIAEAHNYRQTVDYTPFLEYMIIEPDLKEFLGFLKPKFHTAISTNRSNPKPHSEALIRILDHFDLSAADAVYIGDSMVDREHTAGVDMRLISFKNPDLPAEFHVDSFMEIPNLLIFQE
jgi:beta-phosphoglucomutase-like phosphatase (HAD superfamily)